MHLELLVGEKKDRERVGYTQTRGVHDYKEAA